MRVQRGQNWIYNFQDYYNRKPGYGTIIKCWNHQWAYVKWDNGNQMCYPIGINESTSALSEGMYLERTFNKALNDFYTYVMFKVKM